MFCFISPVSIPKSKYSGQKLIKLVNMNIADNVNPTIATVPLMICKK